MTMPTHRSVQRAIHLLGALLLLAWVLPSFSEGTVSEALMSIRPMQVLTISWQTSTNEFASTTTSNAVFGEVHRVDFIPGTGTNQPTTLYDVTLTDSRGLDVALGTGANLSSNTASYNWQSTTGFPVAVDGLLTLTVTNAGSLKSGQVVIHFR